MGIISNWGQAPDWLSLAQAAKLLGPGYDAPAIAALVDSAAIDARRDAAGRLLVEKVSLAAYQEMIWQQQQARKRRAAVVN